MVSLVPTIEVLFKQKTAFLALNRTQLELKANLFAQGHQKLQILQKLLPVELLYLNRQQMQALSHSA